MKKRMVRVVVAALALMLLCAAALAEVRTTGNVWMRKGPGLSYEAVTSFTEGKTLEYLGESSVDERGVTWYKVSSGKNTGWVSSKYSKLVGEEETPAATAQPAEAPAAQPAVEPAATAEPAAEEEPALPKLDAGMLFSSILGEGEGDEAEGEPEVEAEPATDAAALPEKSVELSPYYLSELVVAANEIGLISYRQVESEAPYQYYDDSVIVAGNQFVENIVVYGGGYELFGVHVGMTSNAAVACLNAAGLERVDSMNGITFQHKGGENSLYVNEEGYDSCVNLWVNDEDVVTEIDWSTYTG